VKAALNGELWQPGDNLSNNQSKTCYVHKSALKHETDCIPFCTLECLQCKTSHPSLYIHVPVPFFTWKAYMSIHVMCWHQHMVSNDCMVWRWKNVYSMLSFNKYMAIIMCYDWLKVLRAYYIMSCTDCSIINAIILLQIYEKYHSTQSHCL